MHVFFCETTCCSCKSSLLYHNTATQPNITTKVPNQYSFLRQKMKTTLKNLVLQFNESTPNPSCIMCNFPSFCCCCCCCFYTWCLVWILEMRGKWNGLKVKVSNVWLKHGIFNGMGWGYCTTKIPLLNCSILSINTHKWKYIIYFCFNI